MKGKQLKPKILKALKIAQGPFVREATADAPQRAVTIASYNIHKCVGSDGRFDPARIADVICEMDADVVALQEADKRFGRRDGLLDLESLERRTGLVPAAVSVSAGGHGWHGNALLYRTGRISRLERVALPGAEPRGAIVVDFDMEEAPLRVIAAHLGLLRRSRKRQVDTLVRRVGEGDRPTLILGDLNEWRLGDRSSLLALGEQFGPVGVTVPSFPAQFPVFALDRVLARPEGIIMRIEAHDTPLARRASDHLPIKAMLDLSRAGPARPAETSG